LDQLPQWLGIGMVEGWRGEVLVAIQSMPMASSPACIRMIRPAELPVLEHAILGNIVPDFPLINKSFNLSYSGQDL
jgi:Ni,Fe-hydrogenase III large subunit